MSDDNDKNVEAVDWAQKSAEAMNRHTTGPEFTAKYKAWLEKIGPELWGPVGKADYEKIIAEETAANEKIDHSSRVSAAGMARLKPNINARRLAVPRSREPASATVPGT